MSDAAIFGKYRLIRPLAQGGMAEVFVARQMGVEGFQKTVVVKRVLPHLSRNAEFVQMFLDEARLVARLEHPNVVQVFDFGETNGSYYLTMEYLAGEDISACIARSRALEHNLPSQIAANIVAAACDGLQYVHALADQDGQPLHIVHRDISPGNIVVTYQGAVKILDFGIAKARGKISGTDVGTLKGKYSYMSPQQVRGQPLDGRSDLFSLGAVLYEMLCGVRLFRRDNELATAHAIADEPIIPPSQVRPDLPLEMDAIVMKALSRRLEDRYQTAGEMRTALDHFLAARTYVPVANQLRDYLITLFGEAHVKEGLRAPTTNPHGLLPGLRATVPTVAVGGIDVDVSWVGRSRRAARSGIGAVALALCAGAFLWSRSLRPAVVAEPPLAVTAAPSPPAAPPVPAPTPPSAWPSTSAPIAPSVAVATGDAPPVAAPVKRRAAHRAPSLAAQPSGAGSLSVNCLPWCRVYVDGTDTGKNSPASGIPLPAGKHQLRVVNPPTGRRQEREVQIVAGHASVESVVY